MPERLQPELLQLRHSIAVLEGQRAMLGDAVVDPALAALRERLAALESQTIAEPTPADERRVITVFFADVVGSTAIAERLDPEEWHQTVAVLHGELAAIIQRHHGTVAQYQGDGLLALFGAQHVSEHDPEHAIRAALDAQGAVARLKTPQPLHIRIGIHTGLVVVGELGSDARRELTATGDAMNVAARLQTAAPAGGILISHDTYRHVRGVFNITPQPPLSLKGKQEPVQTYLVRAAKPRPFRTVTRGVAGIQTRTVGRETEFQSLQQAYLDALEQKRVVWAQLVGEAGVGKSRLLDDTRDWADLRPESFRLFRARAYVADAAQPFALIRRLWFDRFQIAEDAPLAQAETKWVQGFQELGTTMEVEPGQALGLLIGLPFHGSPHIGAMREDPVQVKGRAIVVSRELIKAIRRDTPIVMLLEDLQWADLSSWEYLTEVLLDEAKTDQAVHGMLIVGAARPEWTPTPALLAHPGYRQIDLRPLSDEASRELATELLYRVEGTPDEVVRLIVERAEGVPYFAEELVNWFVDRGIIDQSREPWRFAPALLKETPLPATLQHLLLTRLSSLNDTERAVLQRGAIFGRNFWSRGLEALGAPQPEAVLRPLQPRGFVDPQPESSFEGETEWSFHHTLLRDVTYESVLKRERAALHKAAAGWLERQARQAGRLDEFAGLLAEHAERAGDLGAAADWYLRAADHAKAQGAMREAKRFFDRALDLLPPIDRERRWRGLLGREEVLGILGEPEPWREDVAGLLTLAKDLGDDNRLAEAYLREALHARWTGDNRACVQAAEEAGAAARRAGNPLIEVQVLAVRAFALTRLGEMRAAATAAQEALARAEDLGDDLTLARVLAQAAPHNSESGEAATAQRLHTQSAELFRRLGDRAREAGSRVNLGYSYVLLGLYKLGRTTLEQALELTETIGSRRPHGYALQNLGLAYFRSGDGRAARRALEVSLVDLAVVGDQLGRAFSLLYLALVLERLGDIAGAGRRFEEARTTCLQRGAHPSAAASLAGLARCAFAQGDLDTSRRHAFELWGYLQTHGSKGMDMPIWAYQTCADIFDALGEPEPARLAVEAGFRDLMERTEKISDPEWRKSFLENIPEHRALIEMRERMPG
jgi:class 3 adenylate cyclase/tetratricopeptide (TPR) repeat protein